MDQLDIVVYLHVAPRIERVWIKIEAKIPIMVLEKCPLKF